MTHRRLEDDTFISTDDGWTGTDKNLFNYLWNMGNGGNLVDFTVLNVRIVVEI